MPKCVLGVEMLTEGRFCPHAKLEQLFNWKSSKIKEKQSRTKDNSRGTRKAEVSVLGTEHLSTKESKPETWRHISYTSNDKHLQDRVDLVLRQMGSEKGNEQEHPHISRVVCPGSGDSSCRAVTFSSPIQSPRLGCTLDLMVLIHPQQLCT